MNARLWISAIEFGDNTRLDFNKEDIIILVGPNNSGKSTVLRELLSFSSDQLWLGGKVVKKVTFASEGTENELIETIKNRSFKESASSDGSIHYQGYQFGVAGNQAKTLWKELNSLGLKQLSAFFIRSVQAEGRLSIAQSANSIDFLHEVPSHPVHFLYKYESMETEFDRAFKKIFGSELIVNKGSGSRIHLHVGKRPKIPTAGSVLSEEYLGELERLPLIEEQGDGMRSFLGFLLLTLTTQSSILLIDEPEVFLHPPQANRLGRMIVQKIQRNNQMFIATHSEDLVKGILVGDANARMKVIRIDRKSNINRISSLDNAGVRTAWIDPILRFSNVLSGLFHTEVVICEGDADCRFYSAVLQQMIEHSETNSGEQEFGTIDPLFTHCGGKQRIPTIIKALKNLDVKIRVVCDFDILNSEEPLRTIYSDLGGNWVTIQPSWTLIKKQVDAMGPQLSVAEVKKDIANILDSIRGSEFPNADANKIKDVLKKSSPWTRAKNVGKSYLPSGDVTKAFELINTECRKVGLFIVEIGELESFAKSISSHGPKWVNEVILQKNLLKDPELEAARRFVKELVE